MRLGLRSVLALVVLVPIVLGGSRAVADTIFAGDPLTSDQFVLLPDRQATASLSLDFSPFDLDIAWSDDGPNNGLGITAFRLRGRSVAAAR